MLSPTRVRTVPVLAVACALVLSACSALAEDDRPASAEPSAISPDAVVDCAENGDCGQPGAVRWSLPLDGDFYLERHEQSAPQLRPAGHWLDGRHPSPGAVMADGILFVHVADTVTAVDTVTAATLWTESPGFDVAALRMIGPTLVVSAAASRDDGTSLRLLDVDRDGARAMEPDLPEDLDHVDVLTADDTHLVLREQLPWDTEEDPRYFLVEAATGQVEWSARLESGGAHALADETLYLIYAPEDEPAFVAAVTGGERTAEFGVPESAGANSEPWALPGGPLLWDTPDCGSGDARCGGERITAVDPDDGEVLWTHPAPGRIVSTTAGEEVHVRDEDGHRTLDARTGEILAEDGDVDPVALLDEFGAERQDFGPGMSAQEYDLLPVRPTGPGVDAAPLEGLAAGAEHLTAYEGTEGEVVGVYLGCAPDGLRPPSMAAPTGGTTCAEPRLFTVDH
ncbi:PQQ-binding-like beta-propeller repeat protein [Nocardiopsis sp. Huas11]|uniref:outer membrane protein assembly factor BamB family protein n=1 Tax=Nocardiopsis sp. Huas11 TaxID=2183912 RepID=UPI0013156D30|nr:PQQ-binding-like beta-propeller repeat protein [Nocardiopsis sp. Huas11]